MSALNDQEPLDTESGLLLAAFSGTLDVIDEERAHQFGIDQRALENVHELSVKPVLDYMTGYESLQRSEPYDARNSSDADARRNKVWVRFLKDSDIPHYQYPQVLQVINDRMVHFGNRGWVEDQRHSRIVVWLTREGLLLVWLQFWEDDSRQPVQAFRSYPSSKELCEFASTTLDGYKFSADYGHNVPKKPLYLQLRLAQGLMKLLEDTRTRRNEINAMVNESIETARKSQSRIVPGENRSFLHS